MPVASVSRCPSCKAVVNANWLACLVCKTALVREAGPLLAVKLGSPVIGDYWLVLSDDEPFDPGDGLPMYRPSEIQALRGKGYGPEDLQAVHRAKVILNGRIARE